MGKWNKHVCLQYGFIIGIPFSLQFYCLSMTTNWLRDDGKYMGNESFILSRFKGLPTVVFQVLSAILLSMTFACVLLAAMIELCVSPNRARIVKRAMFYFMIVNYILAGITKLTGLALFSSKFNVENTGVCWYYNLFVSLYIFLVICIYLCDRLWLERRQRPIFHSFTELFKTDSEPYII